MEGEASATRSDGPARLGRGAFFGEVALLTGGRAGETVTTATPCRLLILPGRDFRALLRECPAVELRVLRAVAERLAREWSYSATTTSRTV